MIHQNMAESKRDNQINARGDHAVETGSSREQHELDMLPESPNSSDSETMIETGNGRGRFRVLAIMVALSVSNPSMLI